METIVKMRKRPKRGKIQRKKKKKTRRRRTRKKRPIQKEISEAALLVEDITPSRGALTIQSCTML